MSLFTIFYEASENNLRWPIESAREARPGYGSPDRVTIARLYKLCQRLTNKRPATSASMPWESL